MILSIWFWKGDSERHHNEGCRIKLGYFIHPFLEYTNSCHRSARQVYLPAPPKLIHPSQEQMAVWKRPCKVQQPANLPRNQTSFVKRLWVTLAGNIVPSAVQAAVLHTLHLSLPLQHCPCQPKTHSFYSAFLNLTDMQWVQSADNIYG